MLITNSTTLPHNNFLVNLVPVFTVRFCAYLWVEILEHHAVNMHATPNRHCIKTAAKRFFLRQFPWIGILSMEKLDRERSSFFPKSQVGEVVKRFHLETNREHGRNTQTWVLCRLNDLTFSYGICSPSFVERKKYTSVGETGTREECWQGDLAFFIRAPKCDYAS